MLKELDLKLVRIQRNAANKLVRHITKLNSRLETERINASLWLTQAVLEKIAREQSK